MFFNYFHSFNKLSSNISTAFLCNIQIRANYKVRDIYKTKKKEYVCDESTNTIKFSQQEFKLSKTNIPILWGMEINNLYTVYDGVQIMGMQPIYIYIYISIFVL